MSNTQVDTDLGASPKTAFRPPDQRWELYSYGTFETEIWSWKSPLTWVCMVSLCGVDNQKQKQNCECQQNCSYHPLIWLNMRALAKLDATHHSSHEWSSSSTNLSYAKNKVEGKSYSLSTPEQKEFLLTCHCCTPFQLDSIERKDSVTILISSSFGIHNSRPWGSG